MKVVIVTGDFDYLGREENILKVMRHFACYGRYDFIAFDKTGNISRIAGLRVLKVNSGDNLAKCISYVRYMIGDERFFLVFEKHMYGVDIRALSALHRKIGAGITVGMVCCEDGSTHNSGVMLFENEYLDMIDENTDIEKDIIVSCALDGDLGVYYSTYP